MHSLTDDGQVISVEGRGFYAEDEIRRHFAKLETIIARRRQNGARVVAFVDLREAAAQAAHITQLIASETNRLYTDPSDTVIIVVSKMLVKLQFERVHRQQGFKVFISHEEAIACLAQVRDQDRFASLNIAIAC